MTKETSHYLKPLNLHNFPEIIKKLELVPISMTSRFGLLDLLSEQNDGVFARVTNIIF